MTLDEAIKQCLEVADDLTKQADTADDAMILDGFSVDDCRQYIANLRQLVEWLTELKQWRRVYGVCPSYEMCIPECKEGYNAQIAEYKRLLKAAVEDMYNSVNDVHCKYCSKWHTDQCQGTSHLDCYIENKFKWRYADEALKLIES